MNLYQVNSKVDPYVLRSVGYDISRYINFIDKAIKFLEKQSLPIKIRKESIKLFREENGIRTEMQEARYFPFLNKENKSKSEIKSGEKAIDLLFSENTKFVYQKSKKDSSLIEIRIRDKNPDEQYFLLYDDRELETVYLRPDTNQLRQQRHALFNLHGRPMKHHLPLLNLFGAPESPFWQQFYNRDTEIEWNILSDEEKDGTNEQRIFVDKALQTNDFALLEGPPGSGKTTTIIELIVKLVSEGNRVLLCSATHAAIDNVIERITGRYAEECSDIIPLRISWDEKPVKESVRPYLLGNLCKTKRNELINHLKSQKNISESQKFLLRNIRVQESDKKEKYVPDIIDKLILESANLVAGTMIGILQHPDIKNRKIESVFDVLIVDEASKVTFADFIVPALHAKKWILVGDVKQLSPYVEDDYLAEYLKELLPEEERVDITQHFELNNKLDDENYNDSVKIYFTDKDPKIEKRLFDSNDDNSDLITDCVDDGWNSNEENILRLNSADVIFVRNNEKAIAYINKHLYVKSVFFNAIEDKLNYKRQDYIRFRQRSRRPFNFNSKGDEWSDLLAGKLSQQFGFRNTKGFENIDLEIENLLPKKIESEVIELERLVFPSILELLQNGIGVNVGQKSAKVISNGFHNNYKSSRFEALVYQHRMHPHIAQTSKDNFYTDSENESLKPANTVQVDRDWKYKISEPVVMWIHNNDNKFRGFNSKIINPTECSDMIEELSSFLKWAKEHPQRNKNGVIVNYEVAVLTFYLDQEFELRKAIRQLTGQKMYSRFSKNNTNIFLYTVDKFQGQEADMVLLGFTKFSPNAHYNSPNRLNVALTRARHKLLLFGNKEWFKRNAKLSALKELANNYESKKKVR